MVSRVSAILACLLALLVASPLCCCAAAATEEREVSCCSGAPAGENEPCDGCPCAHEDPREILEPAVLPPPRHGLSLEAAAAPGGASHRVPSLARLLPRWLPALPWHAPPAERRARLMSRLL